MVDSRIRQAGQYQAEAYLARQTLDLMAQEFAPATQDEAYLVQREFVERLSETRGRLGGYKVAYTSAKMREASGIAAPCSAFMFADTIVDSPAVLKSSDYVAPAIECEVGVRLSSEVPATGAPYTRENIAPHIESLMTAFEVVDRRPSEAPDGVDVAASAIVVNIHNGGAVLGPAVTDWQGIDLVAARGTMSINGSQVGEGLGSDVMGHPIEALVWLANSLAERGESMPAGSIVITGSIIPPVALSAGDTATISIEGLGEAHLSVV